MNPITSKPAHGTNIGSIDGKPVALEADFQIFFDELEQNLNNFVLGDVVQLSSFAKASLPTNKAAGAMIFVTDDVGGSIPAFFDGTDWRRSTDRAIIA